VNCVTLPQPGKTRLALADDTPCRAAFDYGKARRETLVRKRLRIAAKIIVGLLLLIVVGLLALYWAITREPEFYRQALAANPDVERRASEEMLEQTTALISNVKKEGRWRAVFTAEQINGWLAVGLAEKHPDALPDFLRDPRVAIQPGRMMLACRFQRGGLNSVLVLPVEPYLVEANLLALRVRSPRAGLLVLPSSELLERMSEVATRAGFPVQWRQIDGDPVALIAIPSPLEEGDKLVEIDQLELGEGEIYVSGTTARGRRKQ